MNIIRRSNKSRRRIAAIGMYDGVHLGHRFLIDFMRREGEARGLTPSVVTFANHPLKVVNELRAPRLLTSLSERLDLLDAENVVDCIILDFNDRLRRMSAHDFLSRLRNSYGVDALVVGFNNRFGHTSQTDTIDSYRAIGREIGMEVLAAPEYRGKGSPVSSSIIRRHLAGGNVEKANEALGRTFRMTGKVVSGKGIGHTLGFPTANISVDPGMIVPATGVYAAVAVTPDGTRRAAMVNIGYRPTVEHEPAELSIEAHIIDFTGYLYGEPLRLEIVRRLRDEKRFASTDKLRSQLAADLRRARRAVSKSL